ncbi:MAG: P-loop NTPase [Thermofilum sp.]
MSRVEVDPRAVHARRIFYKVGRVYAIASSKGGVGKTTLACLLSLLLARRGLRVGLMDLDFTNASTHLVLGVDAERAGVEEGEGVKPLEVAGLKLATPVLFTRGRPFALRGNSATDAMLELIISHEWGALDAMVLDLPPGAKDELLEAIGLGAKPLVVTTQDYLSVSSVRRLLRLLKEEKVAWAGVLENMAHSGEPALLEEAASLGFTHLGVIPYDEELRGSVGSPEKLLSTRAALALEKLAAKILGVPRV